MLGGVGFGVAKVAVDQRMGELLLPARQFESVRLEFVAARLAVAQCLPLGDEHADSFL
jgi:hypothetical protein